MQHATGDTQLIALSLRGQHTAFAALVKKYQQYVFTLVLRYEPLRETAEELAQDVFVKAHKNLSSFRHESRFSTWLYTIVHTTCVSHLRSRRTAPLELGEEEQATAFTAPGYAERKSTQAMLSRLIARLPAADAEVITLYYLAEQTIEEIAVITSLSVANIKVRLHRARHKLRDMLQEYPDEIAHLKNIRQ